MHYHLTWGEFALVLAAVLLVYYLIILFGCYRKEFYVFFSRQNEPPALKKTAAGSGAMGAVKADDAEMNLVRSDELEFAEEDYRPATPVDKNKTLLLGGLADFMQELKTLVRITIEGEDTKDNFLSLFRLVASKYASLMDGVFNKAIISYVLDSGLPFPISSNELEQILNDLNND